LALLHGCREGRIDTFEGYSDGVYGSVHYPQKFAAAWPLVNSLFLLDMIRGKDLNVASET
jgi:hypothetical protein